MNKSIGGKQVAIALAAVGGLVVGAPATAGAILGAVSATINSGGPGFGSINDTLNQAGLFTAYTSGVTDYDTYLAGNPQHNLVFAEKEWFSNSGSSSASVTYNLGAPKTVDAFALWNEDIAGIGLFDLLSSIDGMTFTSVLASVAPADTLNNTDYGAQSFKFGAVTAQYFRIDASSCPQAPAGGFESCAIGEVAWRETAAVVPEPGSLALVGLALACTPLLSRRRKA
jgi:hypothetical protein